MHVVSGRVHLNLKMGWRNIVPESLDLNLNMEILYSYFYECTISSSWSHIRLIKRKHKCIINNVFSIQSHIS